MAVSVPASPCVAVYFNAGPDQSTLFNDDSGSIGLYTTFGEDDSNTSFGSWPDPYSCSEVSSFPSTDSFSSLLNSSSPPGLPTEEDFNLAVGAEFLEQFHGPSTPGIASLSFALDSSMLESPPADSSGLTSPPDSSGSEELCVNVPPPPNEKNPFGAPELRFVLGDSGGGRLESSRIDYSLNRVVSNDEDSVTSLNLEPEPVDGVHIPPPLNKKRIEMYDDAYYESIEAAEVPLDVIENKRPFQCGLAGCNKTFKNPQTMKMHHKTHFSDGTSPSSGDLLPTLTPGSGNIGSPGWINGGRSKKIPSRCPKCRKTFVGLYELRRHYGRKHSEGERPFQCRKCDKRFYIEVDVRDHEKLCGESIECKCGLTFAFKCNMVAHKKAHPACQDKDNNNMINNNNMISNNNNINTNSSTSGNITDCNVVNSTSVNIMNSNNSSNSDEDSSISRWITPSPGSHRPKRCHELVEQTRPDLMAKLLKRGTPDHNFPGLSQPEDAASALGFGAYYPPSLWPGPTTSVFGGLDQLNPRRSGKLSALDLLQLAGVTPGL